MYRSPENVDPRLMFLIAENSVKELLLSLIGSNNNTAVVVDAIGICSTERQIRHDGGEWSSNISAFHLRMRSCGHV